MPIATLPNSQDTVLLNDFKPIDKMLIMFGAESTGLSDDLKNISKVNVTIEMSENVESLNLATSVSVIAYELF